ncbi:unnamed protein product, partial [Ceratitis capitata]
THTKAAHGAFNNSDNGLCYLNEDDIEAELNVESDSKVCLRILSQLGQDQLDLQYLDALISCLHLK